MSTDTTKLQQILPDLALSLGRSACEATGRDIRTVTIAVDADSGGDLDIVLGVFNLPPATLMLLLITAQGMLQRGHATVVVRQEGQEAGRFEGDRSRRLVAAREMHRRCHPRGKEPQWIT